MELSDDEKYLICGTTTGLVSIYEIKEDKIKNLDDLFLHSDEITSISINTILNMFATVSKDGYLLLFIIPSFNLVRAIKISNKIMRKKEDKKMENSNENKEDITKEKKEEETKEEIKDEIKEDAKEEKKEEAKEEEKDEKKEEIKDEIKEEIKEGEEKEEGKEDNKKTEEKEEVKEEEIKEGEVKEKEIKEGKEKEEAKGENKEEESLENKNEEIKKDDKDSDNKNKIEENNTINPNDKSTPQKIEENDESKEEEQIYADNVFLSSSPLPCVTIYISKKKLFRTYTINGEFVSEESEEDEYGSQFIKSPIIFRSLNFQDFLIYGTDKGCIKVRSFPKMKLVGNILEVTPGASIETLELSYDKRYCYAWSKGNEINIIKDVNVSSIQVSENITRMGFNIGC